MSTLIAKAALFLLVSFQAIQPSQTSDKSWKNSNYTLPLFAAGAFFLGIFVKSLFTQKNDSKLIELQQITRGKDTLLLDANNVTQNLEKENISLGQTCLNLQNEITEVKRKNLLSIKEHLDFVNNVRGNTRNIDENYRLLKKDLEEKQKKITELENENASFQEITETLSKENKQLMSEKQYTSIEMQKTLISHFEQANKLLAKNNTDLTEKNSLLQKNNESLTKKNTEINKALENSKKYADKIFDTLKKLQEEYYIFLKKDAVMCLKCYFVQEKNISMNRITYQDNLLIRNNDSPLRIHYIKSTEDSCDDDLGNFPFNNSNDSDEE